MMRKGSAIAGAAANTIRTTAADANLVIEKTIPKIFPKDLNTMERHPYLPKPGRSFSHIGRLFRDQTRDRPQGCLPVPRRGGIDRSGARPCQPCGGTWPFNGNRRPLGLR